MGFFGLSKKDPLKAINKNLKIEYRRAIKEFAKDGLSWKALKKAAKEAATDSLDNGSELLNTGDYKKVLKGFLHRPEGVTTLIHAENPTITLPDVARLIRDTYWTTGRAIVNNPEGLIQLLTPEEGKKNVTLGQLIALDQIPTDYGKSGGFVQTILSRADGINSWLKHGVTLDEVHALQMATANVTFTNAVNHTGHITEWLEQGIPFSSVVELAKKRDETKSITGDNVNEYYIKPSPYRSMIRNAQNVTTLLKAGASFAELTGLAQIYDGVPWPSGRYFNNHYSRLDCTEYVHFSESFDRATQHADAIAALLDRGVAFTSIADRIKEDVANDHRPSSILSNPLNEPDRLWVEEQIILSRRSAEDAVIEVLNPCVQQLGSPERPARDFPGPAARAIVDAGILGFKDFIALAEVASDANVQRLVEERRARTATQITRP